MVFDGSEILGTLEKGIWVLTAFSPHKTEWGVTELSEHLHINKTTVHKILATYQRHGMVQQDPGTRRYRLSLRLMELARAVSPQRELRAAAQAELAQLAHTTGETAKLSIPNQDESFVLEAVESREQIRLAGQAGVRNPLYAGASNKIMLAHMPRAVVERIIYERTPADHIARRAPERFLAHLADLAQAGFAISADEVEPGVMAISAPVRDVTGQVIASVSIAGPSVRMPSARHPELVQLVRNAAAAISRRLGSL